MARTATARAANDLTNAHAGRHRGHPSDTGEVVADLTRRQAPADRPRRPWRPGQPALQEFSTNRAPRQKTPGQEGETRRCNLELKVLADVGLLGHAQCRQVHLHPRGIGGQAEGG
jgi:hypothetical protein